MTVMKAIALGIIQGLTEFLPVSSSGHLVFFQTIFGLKEPMIAFDVMVHLGTLLAVFIYFRSDIIQMIVQCLQFCGVIFKKGSVQAKADLPFAVLAFWVVVATLPSILVGLFFEDYFDRLFHSVVAVGILWMIMGIVLVSSRRFQGGQLTMHKVTASDAVLIGCAQAVAMMPGISRSGSTILMAMFRGMRKEDAAKFSFFMAIPAILGAAVLKLKDGIAMMQSNAGVMVAGFAASAFVGYLAIAMLLKLIQREKFYYFGYYCIFMSLVTIAYVSLRQS